MVKENIFSFAKKELTQDAFLMWLIANHDSKDKDVSQMSKHLLSEFIKIRITNQTKIELVEILSQKWKIDILVDLKIDDISHLMSIAF